eukprot:8813979-Lingulodinium_polyedra.AAC.1
MDRAGQKRTPAGEQQPPVGRRQAQERLLFESRRPITRGATPVAGRAVGQVLRTLPLRRRRAGMRAQRAVGSQAMLAMPL